MRQITGVILIMLGIGYITLRGFHYTKNEKVLDIGPIEAHEPREKQLVPYDPILGGATILGGVILLVLGTRGKDL